MLNPNQYFHPFSAIYSSPPSADFVFIQFQPINMTLSKMFTLKTAYSLIAVVIIMGLQQLPFGDGRVVRELEHPFSAQSNQLFFIYFCLVYLDFIILFESP